MGYSRHLHHASAFAAIFLLTAPAIGQNVTPAPGYADLARLPVPVVEGDITDRPYRVIGHIQAGVRKATVFSGSPSREKVFRELWERGKKMKADAVIHAEYGESRVTAMSWGAREARGVAVKFLTDAEIAALPASAPPIPVASPAPEAPASE